MEITHITWNVESGDLALAVAHLVETAYQPSSHKARFVDHLTRGNDVSMAAIVPRLPAERENCLLLLLTQRRPSQQPFQKPGEGRLRVAIHDCSPAGGSAGSLSHRCLEGVDRRCGIL